MFREEENYVALFIDWDNLAISTAADLGGASPDVRAIVRVAQGYGTILLARAYAEWQVPSDRLAVYRAGVDPIYAPTFRFESDPNSQAPRSKSLADPCLVADCIDSLHLMPAINRFVLVSGDKDLIPIVRLAQLRGRRVVVIGPDYVAAILREMADEYVPYRSIVQPTEAASAPEPAATSGRRRRSVPRSRIAAPAQAPAPVPAGPTPMPARTVGPPAQATQPRPVAPEPALPASGRSQPLEQPPVVDVEEPSQNGGTAAEPSPQAEVTEPRSEASPEELNKLLAVVKQILQEREAQGRPRLRATNLKDLLMSRISGFNERRYGFSKLKDLLSAAERAGVLEVNRSGPVHWVMLPRQREEPAAEPAVEAVPANIPEQDGDLIKFIADVRNRSRWLTYTYVLTNLITHLSQRLSSPQAAEAEARNALNRLVQEGVLRIDREPREIEVAGSRHRVRMCHLEEGHPLVQAALARETPKQGDDGSAGAPEPGMAGVSAPSAEERRGEERPIGTQPSISEAPSSAAGAEPAATPGPSEPSGLSAASLWTLPPLPESLLLPSLPTDGPFEGQVAEVFSQEADATSDAPAQTVTREAQVGEGRPAVPPRTEPVAVTAQGGSSLQRAFAALQDVVRQATGPDKPMAGAAGIKTRLVRSLGGFDERAYGFGKFKDFLLAAQRGGYVRVDSIGPATRVGLPADR